MYELQTSAAVSSVNTLAQAAEDQSAKDALAISDYKSQITSLQSQLGNYPGLRLRDLQKLSTWDVGKVSAQIGGKIPSAFSRSWNSDGNLVLSTTGVKGEYDDWLTALHLPGLITPASRYVRIDYGVLFDDKQSLVQCHEFDVEFTTPDGRKPNGSSQIDNSKGGMLNIAKGVGGGWIDTGILVGKTTPGHHTMSWEYILDQQAKTILYLAFTFDGKIYPVYKLAPATEVADLTNWTPGKVHIQLQEDSNSIGGTFNTVYDGMNLLVL